MAPTAVVFVFVLWASVNSGHTSVKCPTMAFNENHMSCDESGSESGSESKPELESESELDWSAEPEIEAGLQVANVSVPALGGT